MPNRVIKETIRTSRNVNALTDFQFRIWVYLITYVDDYGRGSADPELLKGLVFPRRKGVTERQIKDALTALANMGMINLYEVDGESFFYFPKWGEHQRIQTKKSKYPEPREYGDPRWFTVAHGDSPPESNPIQSNPIQNTESESIISTEPETASEPPVITLRLNDGSEFPVMDDQVAEWKKLYPAVDVNQELRNMKGWCDSNPTKRKTRSGILRFVNGWLAKEQDRGRPSQVKPVKGHFEGERKDDLDAAVLTNVLGRLTG